MKEIKKNTRRERPERVSSVRRRREKPDGLFDERERLLFCFFWRNS